MVLPTYTGPELCAYEAHEIVDLLKKREISPVELVEASFARIAAVEPHINAMPTLCRDRAEAAARDISSDDAGMPGWLGGLPIAIKDLMEVGGVRTTMGTKGLADYVPERSGALVERLEARGAIVVGKTNTPEFGAGANTFNDIFGMTRNPWNTKLNAGGSSGGAAAALATGEVWLAHGSDLAGSLRTPAAYCGVVGLRPSPGVAGGGPQLMKFHTEGVQGPMARSVRDTALFLDAMSGFSADDPLSWPAPATSYQQAVERADANIRIAFTADMNSFGLVSQEMDGCLRDALRKTEAAGAVVVEDCPELPDLDRTYRVLRAMLWAALPGRAPDAVQKHFKRTLSENIAFGRKLSIDDVYDAQLNRSRLFDNVVGFLRDFDVLACPVVGLMPGPVEEEYPTEIDSVPLTDYISWLRFSFLATTTALPAISVPVGLSEGGLPIGLQLIGHHRGEARLLAVARAVEVATGGPRGPIDPVVVG
ncbi:amidase [Chelativorans salis]|uniref:Indoleacetamide hydrolase n=1 Tax=Chelativorans salis TaxID=2978478 RepID=A0ABT2LU54_9HYPH|nr:amidase family protein [Chelativorans sp. EGI FJ00035]MCT7377911.1 amidase family protein [Chelativorans sp. EGI FJ00035]